MAITIKDVARQANVSVATVSRALNGHENVAEPVRKRVLAVADALHYSPHHAARSLSSRRTQTIGVVLPDLHGEFFSELMRGIDQVARGHGLHLLVSSYHGRPEEQAGAIRAMRGRVDGLLVLSPYAGSADHLLDGANAAAPTVLINSDLPDAQCNALGVDNYGAARAMVDHLVAQGYRRIAFIAGPEDNFDARDRLRGYRDAIQARLPDAKAWIVQGDFSEAAGHRAGLALLESSERPDAIFAANDTMALGCLFALSQRGIAVPAQIAVAGFDDIPLARYVHPSLTTMRVNIAELGANAMRALLAREGEGEAVPAVQTPELIVRESTNQSAAQDSS